MIQNRGYNWPISHDSVSHQCYGCILCTRVGIITIMPFYSMQPFLYICKALNLLQLCRSLPLQTTIIPYEVKFAQPKSMMRNYESTKLGLMILKMCMLYNILV